ncbi:hypothetical protein GP486_008899, partial [Trichoglossum hirsutum]
MPPPEQEPSGDDGRPAAPEKPEEEEASEEAQKEEEDPLAGVPELRTYVTTDTNERIAALKLIADSVAQQRQIASRAILYHPAVVAAYIAVLAGVSQALRGDATRVLTTCLGLSMAFLAAAQWATAGYLRAAEALRWAWLRDDTVLVSRFGDDIVAAA